MVKVFKHEGKSYEGNFVPVPGKQNYGHLMVGGSLLYSKNAAGKQGTATIFTISTETEVVIADENFLGFFNLKSDGGPIKAKLIEKQKAQPKKQVIDELSDKAKKVVIAIKKYEKGGFFYVKDVKGYTNILYGYIDSLVKKGIIERTKENDPKRGAKFKILK